MKTNGFPFDPKLARLVKSDTLEPHQRPTHPRFKIATDFRQQHMIKHPFLSDFHSRAEHLHAGLLESDPAVSSYVPHPFHLLIRNKIYKPGCYIVADNQPRHCIELIPRGEMPEDIEIPVRHYLAQHNVVFKVKSNESVFEREIEAENWLEIVRILYVARNLTTITQEEAVYEILYKKDACTLGDISDAGDRSGRYLMEIALFRLMHQGHVKAELTQNQLDYDTRVALCA